MTNISHNMLPQTCIWAHTQDRYFLTQKQQTYECPYGPSWYQGITWEAASLKSYLWCHKSFCQTSSVLLTQIDS